MKCIWCEAENCKAGVAECYWIMPDGKSTVRILDIPAVDCPNCRTYVTESVSVQIEEALYLHDLSDLDAVFRYDELMSAPRITRRR